LFRCVQRPRMKSCACPPCIRREAVSRVSGFSCPRARCRSAARVPRALPGAPPPVACPARPAPGSRCAAPRPWSCRWPLSSTPRAGAWCVGRGPRPRHGCGPARGRGRATNVGHAPARGGPRGAPGRGARGRPLRRGSATGPRRLPLRVTEAPMRAGAGKRKTNNPLKYERRHLASLTHAYLPNSVESTLTGNGLALALSSATGSLCDRLSLLPQRK